MTCHALSLKQPWATLLVHGVKRIEVRRWPTHFRGRLLIHAAQRPDDRPEAWRHVPAHLAEMAQRCGGIIGAGELYDCKCYGSAAGFAADQELHLNDPAWFVAGGLYGLCFRDTGPLPFHPVRGYVRIFQLELEDPAAADAALRRFRRVRDALVRPRAPDGPSDSPSPGEVNG